MKVLDSVINKEYELLTMDLDSIRKKVMNDCNLSDADIQKYFILNSKNDINPQIEFDGREYDLYRCPWGINKYKDILDILLKKNLILDSEKIKGVEKLIDVKISEEPINAELKYFRDKYDYSYQSITIDEYINNISSIKMESFNTDKFKETDYLNRAVESSFIVLNKTKDGKYQLIDGFYRLLFKQLNRKVIVKVYSDLNYNEWIQLMITYNAWKINDNNILKFFDRGFLLGLKSRFDINLDTYISYRIDKNIIQELCYYVNNLGSRNIEDLFKGDRESIILYKEIKDMLPNLNGSIGYKNMLSMKYFIDDFKALGSIFNYIPESLPEVISGKFRKEFIYGYNYFINNLITAICLVRIAYRDKEQNNLEVKIIDELLNNKKIKGSLNKSLKMTIRGNIRNRVDSMFPECFKIVKDKLIMN